MKPIGFLGVAAGIWMLMASSALSQWMTQSIPLQAGWNAVYLRVQPEPEDCDSLLEGLPIESVWRWNIRYTTIQFDIDPSQLLNSDTDWAAWLPPAHPQTFVRNLFLLQGGCAYLMRVPSNTAPFTLSLKGRPVLPRITWYPSSLNFVGLPISSSSPPYFSEFFRYTSDIGLSRLMGGGEIYALSTNGAGREIIDPVRERVQAGSAYWIRAKAVTEYVGPLEISLDYGTALDFAASVSERTLHVRNVTTNASFAVTITPQDSESAPDGQTPVAGPVPLSYFVSQPESNLVDWVNFPSALTKTLSPGEDWALRLAVRRAELSEPGLYQSLLRITDNGGCLEGHVPVSAEQP
jgi:hypothetical protein